MIRRAEVKDIPSLNKLLYQVHKVHSDGRPDIFKPGAKKYTNSELEVLIHDDSKPIFVYDDDGILGYAFCAIIDAPEDNNMYARKTIYIDDLCVDASARKQGVGRALFEYVKAFAAQIKCAGVTLNVWALNPDAYGFYLKMGLVPLKTTMEVLL